MQRKLILDSRSLRITLGRLCHQLIERHDNFANTAIIGLQPRGIYPAQALVAELRGMLGHDILFGYLDPTFHRDDFRSRNEPVEASETQLPFSVVGKKVVLVDDVLFTGRTIRAALDSILAFGRPDKIELLTLIDRRYTRDVPIAADYVGRYVHTMASQRVLVELKTAGYKDDKIWLVSHS